MDEIIILRYKNKLNRAKLDSFSEKLKAKEKIFSELEKFKNIIEKNVHIKDISNEVDQKFLEKLSGNLYKNSTLKETINLKEIL